MGLLLWRCESGWGSPLAGRAGWSCERLWSSRTLVHSHFLPCPELSGPRTRAAASLSVQEQAKSGGEEGSLGGHICIVREVTAVAGCHPTPPTLAHTSHLASTDPNPGDTAARILLGVHLCFKGGRQFSNPDWKCSGVVPGSVLRGPNLTEHVH